MESLKISVQQAMLHNDKIVSYGGLRDHTYPSPPPPTPVNQPSTTSRSTPTEKDKEIGYVLTYTKANQYTSSYDVPTFTPVNVGVKNPLHT